MLSLVLLSIDDVLLISQLFNSTSCTFLGLLTQVRGYFCQELARHTVLPAVYIQCTRCLARAVQRGRGPLLVYHLLREQPTNWI